MSNIIEIVNMINKNRDEILALLSGTSSIQMQNVYNFIHNRALDECENLFQYPNYLPQDKIDTYLSFNAIQNMQPTLDYIWYHRKTKINLNGIRELHSILAHGTDIAGGVYRISDAYVERLQQSAPPFHIMLYKINDIEYQINDNSVPVLERAIKAHYDIISAQPFNDFNKRTARMVMNWLLLQNRYTPIMFNKPSDKHDYMHWLLMNARAYGNDSGYMKYMYSCMLHTQNMILNIMHNSKLNEL